MENELMLKIENVSKIYKLGEIGGTTLRESLQRVGAKILKKEDPTKKVGAKNYNKGEKFKALDNISFEVKKGERIGIIGHNGAGKSTLLKLISRVTGPTEGNIYLNGRVASMLEVGTGFHPELTGRENIYMNGAILGMTKKEIDAKMEDIIEFSEVRQFIDTPVKRYSSGMYVKLAFSVAAHLDSEIMIMDEVLAVGDMAFQNKCLNKMKEVSLENERTILYVSHNMGTIRQLCDRVIVLSQGNVIFDGDVEKGIAVYLKQDQIDGETFISTSDLPRGEWCTLDAVINSIKLVTGTEWQFVRGSNICFLVDWKSKKELDNLFFRVSIKTLNDVAIGSYVVPVCEKIVAKKNYTSKVEIDSHIIHQGIYYFTIGLFQRDLNNNNIALDTLYRVIKLKISKNDDLKDNNNSWNTINWGSVHLEGMSVKTE